MQKAISYATTPRCRSQQLLEYFGEESPTCGVCDVCLGRTKSTLSTDDFERYKTKIKQLILDEKINERQLLEAFSVNRHPSIIQTLAFLVDEGQVVIVNGILTWSGKQ